MDELVRESPHVVAPDRAHPADLVLLGVAADAAQLRTTRDAVSDWLARFVASESLRGDVALAVYEAMANVVAHAYPDGAGVFDLRAELTAGREAIAVTVTDYGQWEPIVVPSPSHGRGLPLIRALAGESDITTDARGTRVRLRWPNPSARPVDAVERLRRIDAVTDVALSRLNMDSLLTELCGRLRDLLGADTATVHLYDPATQRLTATVADDLPPVVELGEGFLGAVAARMRPIAVEDVTAAAAPYRQPGEGGMRSRLGVPMVAGGELIGVLHVGTCIPRSFDDDEIHLAHMVADRLAMSTRAELSSAERDAAAALQWSLLPPRLPQPPGLEFAARYVPGADLGVGGDWYDVFRLPGDRWGIVIGDVSGHGLQAAVMMGRLRSALRAYALEVPDPGEVLDKLDRKITHFERGAMATVAYAIIDTTRERVHLSLAGHPPPVLASPDAPAVLLDIPADPLLGFGFAHGSRRHTVVDIPVGTSICFYTDGVVERRDVGIDPGLELLCRTVTVDPPEDVCARVITTLVGSQPPRDDVALLVIRRSA